MSCIKIFNYHGNQRKLLRCLDSDALALFGLNEKIAQRKLSSTELTYLWETG